MALDLPWIAYKPFTMMQNWKKYTAGFPFVIRYSLQALEPSSKMVLLHVWCLVGGHSRLYCKRQCSVSLSLKAVVLAFSPAWILPVYVRIVTWGTTSSVQLLTKPVTDVETPQCYLKNPRTYPSLYQQNSLVALRLLHQTTSVLSTSLVLPVWAFVCKQEAGE